MDVALSRFGSLINPYYQHPHILIPRSGGCIVHALKSLDAEWFLICNYNRLRRVMAPSVSTRVESSTSYVLADDWRTDPYGAVFPELLYLPRDTDELIFRRLTIFCRARDRLLSVSKTFVKELTDTLTRVAWVIAPLSVPPFMLDAPTYHCLVVAQDPEPLDRLTSVLSQHGIRTFHLDPTSDKWPVPEQCEDQAEALWDEELRRGG